MLNACNAGLPEIKWSVVRRKDSDKGTQLLIKVNKTVKDIIGGCDCSLHFGLGSALFKELKPRSRDSPKSAPVHNTVSFTVNSQESEIDDDIDSDVLVMFADGSDSTLKAVSSASLSGNGSETKSNAIIKPSILDNASSHNDSLRQNESLAVPASVPNTKENDVEEVESIRMDTDQDNDLILVEPSDTDKMM